MPASPYLVTAQAENEQNAYVLTWPAKDAYDTVPRALDLTILLYSLGATLAGVPTAVCVDTSVTVEMLSGVNPVAQVMIGGGTPGTTPTVNFTAPISGGGRVLCKVIQPISGTVTESGNTAGSLVLPQTQFLTDLTTLTSLAGQNVLISDSSSSGTAKLSVAPASLFPVRDPGRRLQQAPPSVGTVR